MTMVSSLCIVRTNAMQCGQVTAAAAEAAEAAAEAGEAEAEAFQDGCR